MALAKDHGDLPRRLPLLDPAEHLPLHGAERSAVPKPRSRQDSFQRLGEVRNEVSEDRLGTGVVLDLFDQGCPSDPYSPILSTK